MSNRKDVQQNSRRSPGSKSSTSIDSADTRSSIAPSSILPSSKSPSSKAPSSIDSGGVVSDRDSATQTHAVGGSLNEVASQWQETDVTVGGVPIRTYRSMARTTPGGARNQSSSALPAATALGSQEEGFECAASEMEASWSASAKLVCCINTYPNGITVSLHDMTTDRGAPRRHESGEPTGGEVVGAGQESGRVISPQQFHLRFRDTRDYLQPSGRYFLYREQYLRGLEKHLSQLHHQGILENTVVYFGTTTDPFLTLHKKFDVTMACLQILERYTPKLLVVQTRSPMVISALPTLKHLGSRAVVGIPIETFLEKAVVRYTPGKPRIAERLIAADGLRKQGIRVNLMVSPVLPYGDYERDAWDFAELLAAHGDFVTFGALATGAEAEERALKMMPVAQKLAADKQFLWLRPLCYKPVFQALKSIAPEKLQLPVKPAVSKGQLNLFAA